MKEIRAYVQPHMALKVVHALEHIPGFPGLSIIEAKGFGTSKALGAPHPVEDCLVEDKPKVRLETVVPDEMAEEVVQNILEHARTGRRGDGKVFVVDVGRAVRVRTGEEGDAAIAPSRIPPRES